MEKIRDMTTKGVSTPLSFQMKMEDRFLDYRFFKDTVSKILLLTLPFNYMNKKQRRHYTLCYTHRI